MVSVRELPAPWGLLLGGAGPGGAGSPAAGDVLRSWDHAAGADPAVLRRCARWCDARAGELEGLTESGRALPERVGRAPGGGPAAEDLRAGLCALEGHAGVLREAAAALRAGAVAVETVRDRHEDALSAAARALCAPGASAGRGPGETGVPAGEVRGVFDRSCVHSAAAMRRIDEVLSEALTAGLAHV